MAKYEIYYAEEWAGLYVDGVLDENGYGDSYIAEERLQHLLGVESVYDDAWLLGGNGRSPHPARTTTEIREFISQREANRVRAEAMLAEVDRLRAEAHRLGVD